MLFGKTDSPEVARRLNKLKRGFPSKSRGRFAGLLNEFAPDAVVCTHYVALDTLGTMRSKRNRMRHEAAKGPPFVVSVVTDFEAHALWMDPCVDLYCVAAEETKARLSHRGAEPAQVIASGIPISAKFLSKPIPREVRKHIGLRDDQRVILVLSGGSEWGRWRRFWLNWTRFRLRSKTWL